MKFQLLLKGCTIEALMMSLISSIVSRFQLLLKGCTIEAILSEIIRFWELVSVVVERMYD